MQAFTNLSLQNTKIGNVNESPLRPSMDIRGKHTF